MIRFLLGEMDGKTARSRGCLARAEPLKLIGIADRTLTVRWPEAKLIDGL